MIKRISLILLSLSLVVLIGTVIHHETLAVASIQTDTNSTTFTIRGGNLNDVNDENGKAILKPKTGRGVNFISLDSSLNGRTAELPVGTSMFLYFPGGVYKVTINPNKGIVESPSNTGLPTSLPSGDIALLKVVGQGTATITVTKIKDFKSGLPAGTTHTTLNWSGYERTTGGAFTDITAKWTVPTVQPTSDGSNAWSYAWTGIDDGHDSNGDLIQVGTYSDYINGSTSYGAWWEVLPTYSTAQPIIGTVVPGDNMSAEIKQVSGSTWTVTITDVTQNWTYSDNKTYGGSGSTTEWISERPGSTPLQLANYGSATFTNDTQNGANPQHSYWTDYINMFADDGVTIISTPSNPNGTTDGFSTYYCGSSTGCSTAWSNNSPSGTTSDSIQAMAASSTSNVWAAGYETPANFHTQPVTYLNNGSGWTKYSPTSKGSTSNQYLYGIATSSTDAWTGGYYTTSSGYIQTLAYHWTGSSWGSAVTSANPGGSTCTNQFNAVALDSSSTPWAAGYYWCNGSNSEPMIQKWNGTQFVNQTLTLPSGGGQLNGISFSPSYGWAGGYSSGTGASYLIYKYNGSSWSSPTIGSISNAVLKSVAAISDTEAWAVGYQPNGAGSKPLILHTTDGGSTWTEDTSFASSYPAGTTWLKSVAADSSSDVWIVGYNCNSACTTFYTMHNSGNGWSQVATPSISGSNALIGVSVNSGVAWAGGSNYQSISSPITFKSL